MARPKYRGVEERGIINELMTEPSPYEFEGTLADLRGRINDWIDQYGPTAQVSWDPDRHHAYEHSPSPTFYIHRFRDETDEEWQKRLAERKAQEEAQLARDLVEYERLQKRLGKSTFVGTAGHEFHKLTGKKA